MYYLSREQQRYQELFKNFKDIRKDSATVTSIATVLLPASDKHVHDLSGRNVYNPNICESKVRKRRGLASFPRI